MLKALDICIQHKVKLSDDMAEKMTPPKANDDESSARRLELLRSLAQCCLEQGSFHLACKKFTQVLIATATNLFAVG